MRRAARGAKEFSFWFRICDAPGAPPTLCSLSVAAIYADLGISTTNIGRDMGQWQLNFPTYASAIFTAPRRGQGRKRGGKAEWYATEPALYHMHTKRLRLR